MYQESSHQAALPGSLYRNPVLSGDWPDPAVLREGKTFYLVTSTARYYPSLTIWRSGDMVSFEPLCNPVPRFSGDVWAPDLVRYGEYYYIYFSASGSNFVTRSRHIEEGWCEPVDLRIGRIDPGHCAEDGRRYLMLSGGYRVPLSEDGMSVIGEGEQVMTPAPIPDEWDIEGPYPESPKVSWHDGWYYLTYADGGTGGPATAHMVQSARARSLSGPWEFSPYNPIVHTWSREERWHAKGHGHLVEDAAGEWWILYHAYESGYMSLGRSLLLERIEWTPDGWFRLAGGGPCTRPMRRPAGENTVSPWRLSDDFIAPCLALPWKMYGMNAFSRVKTGEGRLVLAGTGGTPGYSGPLVVSAGDHRYVVSVSLERPRGCEAGLILIYDEIHFAAAGWDGAMLTLYRHGEPYVRVPMDAERIRLFLRNDRHDAAFYIAAGDGEPKKLNYVIRTASMDASAYGGFSSLRPGLFVCGEGEGIFSDFRYETVSPLLAAE